MRPRRHNSRRHGRSTGLEDSVAGRLGERVLLATVTLLAGGLGVAVLLTILLASRMPHQDGVGLQQVLDAAPQLWPDGDGSGYNIYTPPLAEDQQRLRLALHRMGDRAVPILLREVCARDSLLTRWVIRPAAQHFSWLRRFLPDEDQKHASLALRDLVNPESVRRSRGGEVQLTCSLNVTSKKRIVRAAFSLLQEPPDRWFVRRYVRRLDVYALLKDLPEQVEQDRQLMNDLKNRGDNSSNSLDGWAARKVLAAVADLKDGGQRRKKSPVGPNSIRRK